MLTGPFQVPAHVKQAMIFFHGYGSDGDDLIGLAPLFMKVFPDMAIFAPNGPKHTIFDGYEWFRLDDFVHPNLVTKAYLDDLVMRAAEVYPQIDAYIQSICDTYGLTRDKIILGGFSQGGLMAQYTALKSDEPFKAVVAMSSVPLVFGNGFPAKDVKNHLPILLTHGHDDGVVPIQVLSLSTDELSRAKQFVTSFSSPNLGHGINDACIQHVIEFIEKLN